MPNWEDLATTDFAGIDPQRTVAVLPVAAVEQHGPHLPLGTDAILGDAVLARALALLPPTPPVLRLPTQRVGHSPEHGSFAGTLSLRAETVLALWTEIGRSVAAAGLRTLVLLNSHGGQGGLVDTAAQALRCEAGLRVVRCSWYRFCVPESWIGARERRFGLHGGQVETSLMLHVAPHLVRPAAVRDFRSAAEDWEAAIPGLEVEGESGIAWRAEDLNPAGATGDAAAASPELGARLLEHYAARLAAVIAAARDLPQAPDQQARV